MQIVHNGLRYKLDGFSPSFANSIKDRKGRGVTWSATKYENETWFIVKIENKGSEMVRGHLHDSIGGSINIDLG